MENLIDFLAREQPDVIAMQEVFDGRDGTLKPRFRSIVVLQEATGLQHRAFAPTHNQMFPKFSVPAGNAVLSRFPITREHVWFFDVPFQEQLIDNGRDYTHFPCHVQQVTIDRGETTLHVFSTHGIWDQHGNDNPRRLRMGRIIAERMDNVQPAILCGDFNVNEGTQTITRLGERLQNVFAASRRTTSSTFHTNRKTAATPRQ